MKKTVLTMMMMGAMLIGFAQKHIPMSEYYVSPELSKEITAAKVEDLRANNPAELVRTLDLGPAGGRAGLQRGEPLPVRLPSKSP